MSDVRWSVVIFQRMLFAIGVGVSAGAIVAGNPALTAFAVTLSVHGFFDIQDSTPPRRSQRPTPIATCDECGERGHNGNYHRKYLPPESGERR